MYFVGLHDVFMMHVVMFIGKCNKSSEVERNILRQQHMLDFWFLNAAVNACIHLQSTYILEREKLILWWCEHIGTYVCE